MRNQEGTTKAGGMSAKTGNEKTDRGKKTKAGGTSARIAPRRRKPLKPLRARALVRPAVAAQRPMPEPPVPQMAAPAAVRDGSPFLI